MSVIYINEENNKEYKALPCKCCKRKKIISYPKIVVIDDLYYAQCPNCTKGEAAYDYLSISIKGAIKVWNNAMGKA